MSSDRADELKRKLNELGCKFETDEQMFEVCNAMATTGFKTNVLNEAKRTIEVMVEKVKDETRSDEERIEARISLLETMGRGVQLLKALGYSIPSAVPE